MSNLGKLGAALVVTLLLVVIVNQNRAVPLESRPHLTVTGTAEVSATPGEAHISGNFVNEASSQSTANSDNAKAVTAVIDQLKSVGVNETDISTSSISIYPQYDYTNFNGGQPKITGYRASTTVTVKLKQTDLADKVLAKMTDAKAENISGPSYDLSSDDIRAYQNEAQAKALADAASQAESLAVGTGRDLGAIVAVVPNTNGNAVMPMYTTRAATTDMAAAGAAVPERSATGTQSINATVTVTYLLK